MKEKPVFNPRIEVFSAFRKPFKKDSFTVVDKKLVDKATACCACTACTACR